MSLVNPNRGWQHTATTCVVWGWTWRKGRSQLHDGDGWGDTIWLVWYRERLGSGLNGSLGPSMQQELERNPGVQLESATQKVLVHWCIKNMQVGKKTYVTHRYQGGILKRDGDSTVTTERDADGGRTSQTEETLCLNHWSSTLSSSPDRSSIRETLASMGSFPPSSSSLSSMFLMTSYLG